MTARLRTVLGALACAAVCAGASASVAAADFGIVGFSGGVFDKEGASYSQAGGHPFSASTKVEFPAADTLLPDGAARDIRAELPPGFVANPEIVPTACKPEQLTDTPESRPMCPISSQVGTAEILMALAPGFSGPAFFERTGVYKMADRPGLPALFAFNAGPAIPVFLEPEVRSDGDYGLNVFSRETNSTGAFTGAVITLWGNPADPAHDEDRGTAKLEPGVVGAAFSHCAQVSNPECSHPAGYPPTAFITNSTSCSAGLLKTALTANSWQEPDVFHSAFFDHDTNGNPVEVTGCEHVPFDPGISIAPTTDQAETPTGLEAIVDVTDPGLTSVNGLAAAHVKKTVVTLPEGITVNPSVAEGLSICTPAQYAAETKSSLPGEGCPNGSRLGTVQIDTPLLDEPIPGVLYQAQQDDPATGQHGAENPFDSMLAIYVVAKDIERGLVIKLPGKVEPDLVTGQLRTTFDDLPQLPFSGFRLKFREGARAPLVAPKACGTYTSEAEFVPWSAVDPDNPTPDEIVHTTSDFQITRGVGGGPCPAGGLPPFQPGLIAGTLNNNAGSYSPFNARLSRNDGEQEFTNFSIKLPPGVTGKLAGIPYCPDAAIEAAKARTGTAELASPSCPKASEVGRTLVGAGVGSLLTYVPGKIYLAGPYNSSNLSVAAITSAKVGPFDVGTVVIRQALRIDRRTAEVFIDPTGSDPIPHIIDGIPVHARDIRIYVDRPEFVLNPTSCDPTSTASTVLGSGLDFGSPADDRPVTVTTRFQAANCAALPFKPKLKLSVSGSTKRAGNPAFKAVLTMSPGEANIEKAQVTLPGSEFLDNAHIRTVCTRVQYAAEACPGGSIYGKARAFTPILDQPLEGPVYLRSNPEHELPDLVAKLQNGQVVIDLVGRVDSIGKGRIRNTFEAVPDAPVSRFVLEMAGGNKGLLENSANLCRDKRRALVAFDGQNGKVHDFRTRVKPKSCGKKKRKRSSER